MKTMVADSHEAKRTPISMDLLTCTVVTIKSELDPHLRRMEDKPFGPNSDEILNFSSEESDSTSCIGQRPIGGAISDV